jgi:ammonium transporter, Amt family
MVVYLRLDKTANFSTAGLFCGNARQLWVQAGAALTVIVWDTVITFLILRGIKLFMPLRMTTAELEAGDLVVHGEEAYPSAEPVRVPVMAGAIARPAGRSADGRWDDELAEDGPDDPFTDEGPDDPFAGERSCSPSSPSA